MGRKGFHRVDAEKKAEEYLASSLWVSSAWAPALAS
jgi:hypothetical protein